VTPDPALAPAPAAPDASPAGPRALAGVAVIVPAYREAAVLGGVVAELRRTLPRVIVVDDGSDDATAAVAAAAGAQVVRHAVNLGQGAALATGIALALRQGAQVVVTFDADGQHRPEDARALAEVVLRGEADMALGSRFLGAAPGIPRSRRVLLKAAVLLTRLLYGARLTDAHNGLRALSAQAAARIRLRNAGMAHATEIVHQALRLKLRVVERPVTVVYSEYSLAKGQRMSSALGIVADLLTRRLER
jgi:glycosyltransferase involved in cell wall biosynthesis